MLTCNSLMTKDVEYISYIYLPSLVRCLFKIVHFSACLIALVRTFSTLMTRSGERVHSHHILDLRERKSIFFPVSMMLVVGIL